MIFKNLSSFLTIWFITIFKGIGDNDEEKRLNKEETITFSVWVCIAFVLGIGILGSTLGLGTVIISSILAPILSYLLVLGDRLEEAYYRE